MYISVYPLITQIYTLKMANCGQQRTTKDKGWGGDEKEEAEKKTGPDREKGHRRP